MPRKALSVEQKKAYKLKDFKKWVKIQMTAAGMTQTDVGNALGISQETVSARLKIPDPRDKGTKVNPDPFSYGDLLMLFDLFGTDEEERKRLLTL